MLGLPKGIYVSGKGPAVILLHSSLSSAKQWLALVELLSNQFTVINVDILGYGGADKVSDTKNYNFSVEIERINKALELIVPEQPYHIVGHSCGGALGLKFAVENPEKVLSLSLYEPVAFHLLEEGTEARSMANAFAEKVNIDDAYLAAERFTDFWNKKGFFKGLPERMQHAVASDMEKVNLDFIALTHERYSLKDIAKITAPVMLMLGDKSPELSKVLLDLLMNACTQAELVHFNEGHMGPISSASIIQPSIAEFIQNVNFISE